MSIDSIKNMTNIQLVYAVKSSIISPPLKQCPNWFFAYNDNSKEAEYRKSLWEEAAQRNLNIETVVNWYNHKIKLNISNDISYCLFVGGCIDPNEFVFLNTILKSGMTFIDIGACEGLYSIFASTRVGNGQVFSIEPSTREYNKIVENIKLNKSNNIKLISKAISNNNGTAILDIAEPKHNGQNTLGSFVYEISSIGKIKVNTLKLDELIKLSNIERVDIIKIDTDGAEYKILEGAKSIIEKFQPIILTELCDEAIKLQNSNAENVLNLLRQYNYNIFGFNATGNIVPQNKLKNIVEFSENIVAIHQFNNHLLN